MARQEREAHDSAAAKHEFGVGIGSNSHNSTPPGVGRRNVKVSTAVKCQPLRSAEAPEKCADLAFLVDAKNAVET